MINISHIRKSFGDKNVIRDFSLKIADGERIVVMGPSGAGKTTLLRILAGLETSDEGTIEGIPEKKAFVFQEDRLSEDFSVASNIKMGRREKVSDDILKSHLEEIGLEGEAKTKVSKLSGGMKRRVAIARAIIADADIIFMDEPFKGLDESLKNKIMEYVKKHTAGKNVILVTHDKYETESIADRTICLY